MAKCTCNWNVIVYDTKNIGWNGKIGNLPVCHAMSSSRTSERFDSWTATEDPNCWSLCNLFTLITLSIHCSIVFFVVFFGIKITYGVVVFVECVLLFLLSNALCVLVLCSLFWQMCCTASWECFFGFLFLSVEQQGTFNTKNTKTSAKEVIENPMFKKSECSCWRK